MKVMFGKRLEMFKEGRLVTVVVNKLKRRWRNPLVRRV